MHLWKKTLASMTLISLMSAAHAADLTVNISIKDHKFYPSNITVPAGQRLKFVVTNLDKTPEEFESDQMKFEKIVSGGGRITVFAGPLSPGRYNFFGEFNLGSAQGYVTAK